MRNLKRVWVGFRMLVFALWVLAVGGIGVLWVVDRGKSRLVWEEAKDHKSIFAAESHAGHVLLFYGRLPDGTIYESLTRSNGGGSSDVYLGWRDPREEITRHTGVYLIGTRGDYGHLWPYSSDRWPFISFPWHEGYLHIAHGSAPVPDQRSVTDRVVWFHLISPNWLALVVLGGIPGTIFAARGVRYSMRRRYRVGCCEKCGYDLRASRGRCPECGAVIAAR